MQKLKAPQNSGHSLVYPGWDAAADLLATNQRCIQESGATILDMPLRDLAAAAKRELVQLASEYTGAYQPLASEVGEIGEIGDLLDADNNSQRPIIVSGHQPTLFHPGVWFKNFALHRLAKMHAGIGVHLLIDNDLSRDPAIQVLSGSAEQPALNRIELDSPCNHVPHEVRAVVDDAMFRDAGNRIAGVPNQLMASGSRESDPDGLLIDRLWPYAVEALDRTRNMGECVSQARHQVERDLGLANLEVPLSRVCDGKAFQHFFAHMLSVAERLHASYNDAIREYRESHNLRSRSHPAPLLRKSEAWLEIPFWAWQAPSTDANDRPFPTREPLFFREEEGKWNLSIGEPGKSDSPAASITSLPVTQSASDMVLFRAALEKSGFRIRPRALLTTMFARLCLSDLFLHGIGGAKYDTVTNRIMEKVFGIEPPGFMAISATFRPELPSQPTKVSDASRIERVIRDLWYHPERTDLATGRSAESELFTRLKAAKQDLLTSAPVRGQGSRKAWHDELATINEKLRGFHDAYRNELLAEQKRVSILARNARLLSSREYSLCVFPYRRLSQQLLALSS